MKRTSQIQLKSSSIKEIRDKLYKEQKGICPICQKEILNPVLDHHHKKRIKGSGLVRGVLCRTCNVFLAKSENNCIRYAIGYDRLPDVLRAIADYLEKDHSHYIHPSEKPKEKKLKKSSYNQLKKEYQKRPVRTPFPEYPKSGKLIKSLEKLYQYYNIQPEFYK